MGNNTNIRSLDPKVEMEVIVKTELMTASTAKWDLSCQKLGLSSRFHFTNGHTEQEGNRLPQNTYKA